MTKKKKVSEVIDSTTFKNGDIDLGISDLEEQVSGESSPPVELPFSIRQPGPHEPGFVRRLRVVASFQTAFQSEKMDMTQMLNLIKFLSDYVDRRPFEKKAAKADPSLSEADLRRQVDAEVFELVDELSQAQFMECLSQIGGSAEADVPLENN